MKFLRNFLPSLFPFSVSNLKWYPFISSFYLEIYTYVGQSVDWLNFSHAFSFSLYFFVSCIIFEFSKHAMISALLSSLLSLFSLNTTVKYIEILLIILYDKSFSCSSGLVSFVHLFRCSFFQVAQEGTMGTAVPESLKVLCCFSLFFIPKGQFGWI